MSCPLPEQDFLCPLHPCGSILKIQFVLTWGDPSFLGLERIQILSPDGDMIPIDVSKVMSIFVIPDFGRYLHFHPP